MSKLGYNTRTLGTGHVVRWGGESPAEGKFLKTLEADCVNPRVSYDQMLAKVYGLENPILDKTLSPGQGTVTREVLRNPLYRLMQDLLEKKAIQQKLIVPERDFARYTLTVEDAAKVLGLHPSVVRTAANEFRLAARKAGRKWMIDPAAVEAYQISEKRHLHSGARKKVTLSASGTHQAPAIG